MSNEELAKGVYKYVEMPEHVRQRLHEKVKEVFSGATVALSSTVYARFYKDLNLISIGVGPDLNHEIHLSPSTFQALEAFAVKVGWRCM